MSSGLYSGQPGLSLGTGLYRTVSSLWSGASGLAMAFGGAGMTLSLDFLTMTAYTLDPRITFSRGSQAMVTDATGKLTYAPNNLLTNSESFEAAAWAKTNATVTANTVAAPDGTTTADTLVATNANATALQTFTATGATYIYSVYIRRKTGTGNIDITVDGTTYATKSVTSSWVRYDTLLTPAAGSKTAGVRIATSGDEVYIWGAQLEAVTYQTTPSPYVSTTPKNLLGYTQEFNNAAWGSSGFTVTANSVTAPDGSLTADALFETAVTNTHTVGQLSPAINGTACYSIYLKGNGRQFALIGNTTTAISVDLSTGAVTSQAGSPTGLTSTNAGNGWWRVSYTAITGIASQTVYVYTSQDGIFANRSFTGDVTKGIYIWGAQLSNSASVDPYVYNPGAAPTSAAYYGPRFDYDPVTLAPKGLLIEEQRTNLLTYSEQFDNAAWVKSVSIVTANATTSPDGTVTADKLIASNAATLSVCSIRPTTAISKAASATTYTYTIYAKAAEFNRARAYVQDSASSANNASFTFSLVNGSITTAASAIGTFTDPRASVTDVGNGWYRAALTFTSGTETGLYVRVYTADSTITTGDGTSGIFIYGAQLEAGAFATSYIPTVASTVTRSADVAQMLGTNFSSWYNSAEGSVLVAFDTVNPVSKYTYAFSDGSSSNFNGIDVSSAGNVRLRVTSGGVSQATVASAASISANTVVKAAAGYKTDSFQLALNNVQATEDTSGSVPTANQLTIGGLNAGSQICGHIRTLSYYNTRLSNTQLQALTA